MLSQLLDHSLKLANQQVTSFNSFSQLFISLLKVLYLSLRALNRHNQVVAGVLLHSQVLIQCFDLNSSLVVFLLDLGVLLLKHLYLLLVVFLASLGHVVTAALHAHLLDHLLVLVLPVGTLLFFFLDQLLRLVQSVLQLPVLLLLVG